MNRSSCTAVPSCLPGNAVGWWAVFLPLSSHSSRPPHVSPPPIRLALPGREWPSARASSTAASESATSASRRGSQRLARDAPPSGSEGTAGSSAACWGARRASPLQIYLDMSKRKRDERGRGGCRERWVCRAAQQTVDCSLPASALVSLLLLLQRLHSFSSTPRSASPSLLNPFGLSCSLLRLLARFPQDPFCAISRSRRFAKGGK